MNLDEFRTVNISDGDKSRFLNAFNDTRATTKMAYFEHDGVCYTATDQKGPYGPLFKLCGAGISRFSATTNYEVTSANELGAMTLHNATSQRYTPSTGSAQKIPSKVFKIVEIKVAQKLRAEYPIPNNVSPIVSDIQSESASVKDTNGKYTTCGMRTVHRLYLATAFTILRKLHDSSLRDGVVALVVEKGGRIISWGRKNPAVPCWHGETSAIMGLGGQIPAGCCIYSTLKPCQMCAGMIHDASGGNAKVFWGQDDPTSMAANTKLDETRMGRLLDGNKTQTGARAILLAASKSKTTQPMSQQLGTSFTAQKKKPGGTPSTIDYIVTDEAAVIIKEAEKFLKAKQEKYGKAPTDFNENTAFVVRYLTEFMGQLGLRPENLGV
jgi:tRNA(Arg) A34 adenosine deaminase TadA